MANSPVHINSFQKESLPKTRQGLAASLGFPLSGKKPAPNKNTPNTTKTTPMCSIPTLVTTCQLKEDIKRKDIQRPLKY